MLRLQAGALELLLAPGTGGSIARLDWHDAAGRWPIMRGDDAPESPLETGCFPLVPYCNRIRGGRFAFRGREVRIAPNMAGDASPLHGTGWLAPWEVVDVSGHAAELSYRHPPGEWPWAFEARQRFELSEATLRVELTCTNLSDEAMPCGLGLHPYFPCDGDTRLSTAVDHVWTVDEQVLPVERVPASGRYDLSGGPVCGRDLDNGFGGWSGAATIMQATPPLQVEMSSEARFFQLYSPASGGLFVAEPVSHANAALNEPEELWPALGLRVLAPGEDMALTMTLKVKLAV